MTVEFKTTTGDVTWDDKATCVEYADDPVPPTSDAGWQLVGSTCTEVRYSKSTILWFWRRESGG